MPLPNATASASGDYIFSVTQDGCTARDTVTVNVKPLPSAQISSSAVPCVGQAFALSNTNTVTNSTYAWAGPNGYASSQQNLSFSNFNFSDTGTYQLTVTANGCSASSSVQTTAKPIPSVQFASLNDVCADALPLTLVATETTGIVGSDVWQLDGQTATNMLNIQHQDTGLHTIRYTFTANNGCSSFKEQPLYIHPLPLVNAGNDATIFLGNSVALLANITGQIATIKWTPNLYLNLDDIVNPISLPKKDIAYRLDVATLYGCTAFDSVHIKVISNVKVPNSFSPNGDGINDTWSIEGLEAFPRATVQIFDRGGRKVFSTQGVTSIYWNGQVNGKPLPTGTYYYVVQLNDAYLPKPIAGWVMLLG